MYKANLLQAQTSWACRAQPGTGEACAPLAAAVLLCSPIAVCVRFCHSTLVAGHCARLLGCCFSLAALAALAAAAPASSLSRACHMACLSKRCQAGWPAASAMDLHTQGIEQRDGGSASLSSQLAGTTPMGCSVEAANVALHCII